MKLKIEYVNPADLLPADYNPREIGKEHLARLAKLLDSHGFVDPVIARRTDMLLLGGHQRIKANAMRDTPDTKVPAILLDDISDDQCKVLNISLNNPNAQGTFDIPKLSNLLLDIDMPNFDLSEFTGFSVDELADLMTTTDPQPEDDEVPAVQDKAITRNGDVWILGDNRLLCGDSTKAEDVERLMGGKKADMVFTDPPYGMDFQGSVNGDGTPSANRRLKQISNETGSKLDKKEFIESWVPNIMGLTENAWYICYSRHNLRNLLNVMHEKKYCLRNIIVWNKNRQNVANTDYKSKYELILYGWTNRRFFGPDGDNDVWEIDKLNKCELHPTMKPVKLLVKAILNSSQNNEIVADLFLGSGTTLIACEQTNRRCYGMEIDQHYCDVIIRRWQNFTGRQATREIDGRLFDNFKPRRTA